MKFLCHAGPWSANYLSSIVKCIDPQNSCRILSTHKSVDSSGVVNLYYQNLEKKKEEKFKKTAQDDDIILRCRLLRNLENQKALLHLNSMRDAICSVLDKINPDIVLSETIDSYVMDILYFESLQRKISFIGLVSVFVNGYFRISARGEYNFVRNPSKEETLSILESLENKDYLPAFVQKDKKNPTKATAKKWMTNIIKIPYFYLKRVLSRDFYNYHYWQQVIISKQSFHFFPRFQIGNKNWESALKNIDQTVIYIPLQMVPEATVDYWCNTIDVINYNETLINFIKNHQDLHFLVKEHPNVIGYRNPKLYRELKKQSNVTICPTQIKSNHLYKHYSAVLVWTGTVGFESALRGKKVLCFSQPYYFPNNNYFKLIKNETSTQEINSYIIQKSNVLTHEKKIELVTHLLSGIDRGSLIVDGSWNSYSQSDHKKMEEVAKSLKKYIQNMNK